MNKDAARCRRLITGGTSWRIGVPGSVHVTWDLEPVHVREIWRKLPTLPADCSWLVTHFAERYGPQPWRD